MCLGDEPRYAVQIERLAQNAVSPPVEGPLHHVRCAECGHEHNGAPWQPTPDVFEQAQIVRIGQAIVEQHDIDWR